MIVKVPLQDLNAGYKTIRSELIQAVSDVMDAQQYVLGPKVAQLEEKMADLCHVSYGVGVSSGSDALLLALMALDIKPGDEVITTPFTFFATAGSIVRVGAKPVFVDIDPETFNIDPGKIETALTPNTKAIMPVHLYGQVAEMDDINSIAQKHHLMVIEDAAQAVDALHHHKPAGAFGDAACFSFYPTKNLGAAGDSGMVVTDNEDVANRLRQLRQHGEDSRYLHATVGINGRMDGIQAAVLLTKLSHLDRWNKKRIEHARHYTASFQNIDQVTPPVEKDYNYHVYHQYVIRCQQRDQLRQYLTEHQIGSGVYYPMPLHLQPCFTDLGYKSGDYPNAEAASKEVLALPVFPEMTRVQQDTVIDAIREFYRNSGGSIV
jgi:dTDP-4-amino-4,6-dideoxygalactose transaminase